MRDATTILAIVLLAWTAGVVVWALWALGPVRTRRVERSRREPW